MVKLTLDRHLYVQRGKRLEYFTIAWNSLEGIVAFIAGILANSISLVGFGVDSFIEVASSAALLRRMSIAESLHDEFGIRFRLEECFKELHRAPLGTTQQFLYCYFKVQ